MAQAQLIETALLNMVNFQTLIATKAARIKSVIGTDPLLEFGSRRAQELDAAIWGPERLILEQMRRVMCGQEDFWHPSQRNPRPFPRAILRQ